MSCVQGPCVTGGRLLTSALLSALASRRRWWSVPTCVAVVAQPSRQGRWYNLSGMAWYQRNKNVMFGKERKPFRRLETLRFELLTPAAFHHRRSPLC